jgi:hypothetical protein
MELNMTNEVLVNGETTVREKVSCQLSKRYPVTEGKGESNKAVRQGWTRSYAEGLRTALSRVTNILGHRQRNYLYNGEVQHIKEVLEPGLEAEQCQMDIMATQASASTACIESCDAENKPGESMMTRVVL